MKERKERTSRAAIWMNAVGYAGNIWWMTFYWCYVPDLMFVKLICPWFVMLLSALVYAALSRGFAALRRLTERRSGLGSRIRRMRGNLPGLLIVLLSLIILCVFGEDNEAMRLATWMLVIARAGLYEMLVNAIRRRFERKQRRI